MTSKYQFRKIKSKVLPPLSLNTAKKIKKKIKFGGVKNF